MGNKYLKELVEVMHNRRQGCVGAICHAPLALADCTLQNGRPLLQGKFVAAFSNEEEEILGLSNVLHVLTENVMDQAGAICVPAQPW